MRTLWPWGPILGYSAHRPKALPVDQSVWVGSEEELSHLSAAGSLVHTVEFEDEKLHALALYVDGVPPVLSFTAPTSGAFLNTATPTLVLWRKGVKSFVDKYSLFCYSLVRCLAPFALSSQQLSIM